MRQTLEQMNRARMTASIEISLILALPSVQWNDYDYALYMSLDAMWHQIHNPTYREMKVIVVSYLTTLKRLIDRLPVQEAERARLIKAFDELSEPYKDLIK